MKTIVLIYTLLLTLPAQALQMCPLKLKTSKGIIDTKVNPKWIYKVGEVDITDRTKKPIKCTWKIFCTYPTVKGSYIQMKDLSGWKTFSTKEEIDLQLSKCK